MVFPSRSRTALLASDMNVSTPSCQQGCRRVLRWARASSCKILMRNVQIRCCNPCRPLWEAAHLTKGAGNRCKWCCCIATASLEGRPYSGRQCIMQFAEAPAVAPVLETQDVGRPRMLLALLLMQARLGISQAASTISCHGSHPGLSLPASVQPDPAGPNLGCTRRRPAMFAAVHLLHWLGCLLGTTLNSCDGRHVQLRGSAAGP